MDDLFYQSKFAGAFRLGGFRFELHRVSVPTEADDFDIRLIDLGDAASPTLRLDIGDCERIIGGLQFLKAMKEIDRGDVRPETIMKRLRSLTEGPTQLAIEQVMLELDGQRRRETAAIPTGRDQDEPCIVEVA
jgi:hypothetical protein